MTTLVRPFAILVGPVALVLAVSAAALADTYRHVDARHDVERALQQVRAPHNRTEDVIRLLIVHSDASVRFFVTFRSGSMKGVDYRTFVVALKTPRHDYQAMFIWNHGGDQEDSLRDQTSGRNISCDQTISRANRTFVLRIKSSCVHQPRWVRAAFLSGLSLGPHNFLSDNPLSNHWQPSREYVYSPRVRSSIEQRGMRRWTGWR